MTITAVTAYTGTVPVRTQSPTDFATNADNFVAFIKALGDELVVSIPEMNTDIATTGTNVTAAQTAATNAEAAQTAAELASAATLWVSGVGVTVGLVYYSPTDFLSYRCKNTLSGGANTEDPADDADETNWAPLGATLAANTFTGTQNFADNTLQRANLLDYGEVTNAIGSTGGGTQDIDLTLGNSVSATVDTSANTFTFSNPTASDELCGFVLFLTNGGSQTVNWPASVDWPAATAPTLSASGLDILVFSTIDGGTIWHGQVAATLSS